MPADRIILPTQTQNTESSRRLGIDINRFEHNQLMYTVNKYKNGYPIGSEVVWGRYSDVEVCTGEIILTASRVDVVNKRIDVALVSLVRFDDNIFYDGLYLIIVLTLLQNNLPETVSIFEPKRNFCKNPVLIPLSELLTLEEWFLTKSTPDKNKTVHGNRAGPSTNDFQQPGRLL